MTTEAATTTKQRISTRAKMQRCVTNLGIQLRVVWAPKPDDNKHGEVRGDCLLIYDGEENEAWRTLYHEIVEYRLKEVTGVYRSLVNQLIEGYEQLAYQRKEQFINFLPRVSTAIQAEISKDAHTRRRKDYRGQA